MTSPSKLSASQEDYLETIYHIEMKNRVVRVKDIAQALKVNSPSVTGALNTLKDKNLVNYAPYKFVTLTEKGKAIARGVIHRHNTLRDFFIKVLRVDHQESDEAACRMEHAIPKTILERLIKFIEFIDNCPLAGAKWVDGFGYFCDHGDRSQCERCISEFAESALNRIEDTK